MTDSRASKTSPASPASPSSPPEPRERDEHSSPARPLKAHKCDEHSSPGWPCGISRPAKPSPLPYFSRLSPQKLPAWPSVVVDRVLCFIFAKDVQHPRLKGRLWSYQYTLNASPAERRRLVLTLLTRAVRCDLEPSTFWNHLDVLVHLYNAYQQKAWSAQVGLPYKDHFILHQDRPGADSTAFAGMQGRRSLGRDPRPAAALGLLDPDELVVDAFDLFASRSAPRRYPPFEPAVIRTRCPDELLGLLVYNRLVDAVVTEGAPLVCYGAEPAPRAGRKDRLRFLASVCAGDASGTHRRQLNLDIARFNLYTRCLWEQGGWREAGVRLLQPGDALSLSGSVAYPLAARVVRHKHAVATGALNCFPCLELAHDPLYKGGPTSTDWHWTNARGWAWRPTYGPGERGLRYDYHLVYPLTGGRARRARYRAAGALHFLPPDLTRVVLEYVS